MEVRIWHFEAVAIREQRLDTCAHLACWGSEGRSLYKLAIPPSPPSSCRHYRHDFIVTIEPIP